MGHFKHLWLIPAVSLTHSRHCLWILGNERTLISSESIWGALVCDAKARQCFFNADEDRNVAKARLDIGKELVEIGAESLTSTNQRGKVCSFSNSWFYILYLSHFPIVPIFLFFSVFLWLFLRIPYFPAHVIN